MYSTKLIYSNPFIQTDALAKRIADKVFGLSYMPSKIHWRGNPAVQAGDALRLTDRAGETHTILVMAQTINFSGGLSSEISCPGEIAEEADGVMPTPAGQQISTAVGQLDADLKLYIAEVCRLTLQQANSYTDEAIAAALKASF